MDNIPESPVSPNCLIRAWIWLSPAGIFRWYYVCWNIISPVLLWATVNYLASANGVDQYDAIHKFFLDIEEQYDNKLGFESEIENLQLDYKDLREEENTLCEELFAHPLVSFALSRVIEIDFVF